METQQKLVQKLFLVVSSSVPSPYGSDSCYVSPVHISMKVYMYCFLTHFTMVQTCQLLLQSFGFEGYITRTANFIMKTKQETFQKY
jgi:hypothetical protein